MSNSAKTSIRVILISVIASLLLPACATSPGAGDPENIEGATASVEQKIAVEPVEGDVMDIPLNGSSLDAFNASLARVEAYATEAEYEGLRNALDYLLLYDLGAEGDMEKLASRVDGLTPREVFKRVKWRRPAPGKSQAEEGAADAKIFDS